MQEICPTNKLPKTIVQQLLLEKPERNKFKNDNEYRDCYALWSIKVLLAQQTFSNRG